MMLSVILYLFENNYDQWLTSGEVYIYDRVAMKAVSFIKNESWVEVGEI